MNTKAMKDNWIKPFQEKLGDYELELPAAGAAGRRKARIIPLVLAGAAAAVMLLVLLLRTPVTTRPEPLSRLIAEAAPTLAAPRLDPLAPVSPLPKRSRTAAEPIVEKTVEQAVEQAVEQIATPDGVTEQPTPPTSPTVSQVSTPENPETEQAPTTWLPETDEAPARKTIRLSGRVHVDPSFLRNNTVQQEPMGQWIMSNYVGSDKRAEKLNYWMESNYAASTGIPVTNEAEIRHDLPVKTGISLVLEGPGRFSLESSLNYDFHRSRSSYQNACELDYRMHYAGLAVKGLVSLAEWEKVRLYTGIGVEGEYMVAGRLYTRNNGHLNTIDPLDSHPFLFSVNAAAGVEYRFSSLFGLYVEPGVALHTRPRGNLPDYYREHPFSFDLHVGFRFNL